MIEMKKYCPICFASDQMLVCNEKCMLWSEDVEDINTKRKGQCLIKTYLFCSSIWISEEVLSKKNSIYKIINKEDKK